ncbi:ABC transporter ATP-binding protein [Estrella lausannensis]|nr:ABC transporter ATP-binding protein [Estrella lausannensis]
MALSEVSFDIGEGEIVALIGESGSGKSTIAKAIVGIQPSPKGTICYRGECVESMSRLKKKQMQKEIQIIFQDPYSALNPKMTVSEAIMEPLIIHQMTDQQHPDFIANLLQKVLLPKEFGSRLTSSLSGGERQRVAIARALSVRPKLIIMDESLASLDIKTQHEIALLVQNLSREELLSILFISHDLNIVQKIAGRMGVLLKGKMVEWGPSPLLFSHPKHPYTRLLFASNPSFLKKRGAVEGLPPLERRCSPPAKEGRCPFLNSCASSISLCTLQEPDLREVEPAHYVRCFL